jgi:hypothetical protein
MNEEIIILKIIKFGKGNNMKFKVGDKVRLHSVEWFSKNNILSYQYLLSIIRCNPNNNILFDLNSEYTINYVGKDFYKLAEDTFGISWWEWMFEDNEIEFSSVKKMVNWLLDNEGKELYDSYGRKWKYERYSFYFQDIGDNTFKEEIDCLHLFSTKLFIKNS